MIKPHIDPYYAECSDDFAKLIIAQVQKRSKTTKQEIIKAFIRLKFYRWAICMPHLLLHDSLDEWADLVMADLKYRTVRNV